jgi:hypothetical protein
MDLNHPKYNKIYDKKMSQKYYLWQIINFLELNKSNKIYITYMQLLVKLSFYILIIR